jgi:hypothetical protein
VAAGGEVAFIGIAEGVDALEVLFTRSFMG